MSELSGIALIQLEKSPGFTSFLKCGDVG